MDKQAVLNGASFKLVEESEKIFRLKQEKWNDYVYNTLFSLWMTTRETINLHLYVAHFQSGTENVGQTWMVADAYGVYLYT